MDEREREIAAWSIDWEGSICLNTSHIRNSRCIFPRVSITNTNKELLEAFMEIVKIGTIRDASKSDGIKKPSYMWYITSQITIGCFLDEILPYLKAKKCQAELVLEYCMLRLDKGRGIKYTEEELEYYKLVRSLNNKGVKAVKEPLLIQERLGGVR